MASAAIQEFLGSSTIHGLVHISTAKSRAARTLWVAIVVACFAFAVHMITGSYREWQQSPVSTTISTHPITELDFPAVTVCPPRGSNTAPNHLLEKVKDVNFTVEERQELLDISKEVFVRIPSRKNIEDVTELLSVENMRSIINGEASLPELDEENMITMRTSEPQGMFRTPGFGDFLYSGNFFDRPRSLHYLLNLPENLAELVGDDGALVISVHSEGDWSIRLQEQKLQLYKQKLNMSDAEEFCVNLGGHLPSVWTRDEQAEISKVSDSNYVWLGGERESRNLEVVG